MGVGGKLGSPGAGGQVDHDARPSVSVNIVGGLNEYLKASKGLPESVQKLQSEAGIKLVITNLDDPDSLGCFAQYRVAFFVAGEVESLANFFLLFDGYLAFKNKQLARASPFEGESRYFSSFFHGHRLPRSPH